jgi:hypothetical protein
MYTLSPDFTTLNFDGASKGITGLLDIEGTLKDLSGIILLTYPVSQGL